MTGGNGAAFSTAVEHKGSFQGNLTPEMLSQHYPLYGIGVQGFLRYRVSLLTLNVG